MYRIDSNGGKIDYREGGLGNYPPAHHVTFLCLSVSKFRVEMVNREILELRLMNWIKHFIPIISVGTTQQ